MTETTPTTDRLVLAVYRTRAGNAIQVQLCQLDPKDCGVGYRLAGPKHHNMGCETLLEEDIDERDAAEVRRMLDAVYPVAPRRISSPEELDALPIGSVVLHPRGDALSKLASGWCVPGHMQTYGAADLLSGGPVTLLHAPTAEAGQ